MRVLLTNVYKRVLGNFFSLFESWVLYKPGFFECVETRLFFILENNSRSNQNKKIPKHALVDIGKQEKCAKF